MSSMKEDKHEIPLADFLRQWRADEGLSRDAAAQLLGVTERNLEHWENGRSASAAVNGLARVAVRGLRARRAMRKRGQ